MKRMIAASLVFVCTTAVSSADEQPPATGKSALYEAKEKFLQAETQVGFVLRDAIVEGFLNSSDAPDDQRQALREKLRPAVGESFDARQRLQAAELEGLRRRLAEIEQAVAAREKIKDAIVNARLDSLLIGLNGVGAKTMQHFQDNGLKPQTGDVPAGGKPPNLGADKPPGTVVVPFTTAIPARFAGEVLRIGQKSEEADGQGGNRQRPLAFGDNVAANELLAVIGEKRADGKAWSGREIRAPHVGIIAEKNINVGDVVRPGDVLFQIRQIVERKTAVQSRTAGTVMNIGLNRQQVPLSVGDKVKADDLLAELNTGKPRGFAIVAPIDGVIMEKNVKVGDVVQPGDTLFQISSAITGGAAAGELPLVPFVPESASGGATSTEGFDLETREQLAQIDVQEAQADIDAADKQVMLARKLYESARAPYSALAAAEKDLRRAKAELDRAKVKVEGVKRQREAAAKEAAADAEGQRNMAVGMVRAKEGNRNAAQEGLKEAEAALEAATAKRDYEVIQSARIQKLFDGNAVEASVVEEQKQKLAAAEAARAQAMSKVRSAKAYLHDTETQLEQAMAAVEIREAKLDDARSQLQRLLSRSTPKPPVDADAKPKETQP